ncbi:MAG: hypothetical protein ACI9MJ_002181, partial [Alphaproteobacteria bacterium]
LAVFLTKRRKTWAQVAIAIRLLRYDRQTSTHLSM